MYACIIWLEDTCHRQYDIHMQPLSGSASAFMTKQMNCFFTSLLYIDEEVYIDSGSHPSTRSWMIWLSQCGLITDVILFIFLFLYSAAWGTEALVCCGTWCTLIMNYELWIIDEVYKHHRTRYVRRRDQSTSQGRERRSSIRDWRKGKSNSRAGNRTRAAAVRAPNPSH